MRLAYRILFAVAVVVVGIPVAYCLFVLSAPLWMPRAEWPGADDVIVQCAIAVGLIALLDKAWRLAGEERLLAAIVLLALLDLLLIAFLLFAGYVAWMFAGISA